MITYIQRDITIVALEANKELRFRRVEGESRDLVEVDIVINGRAGEPINLPKEALLEFMAHAQEVLS